MVLVCRLTAVLLFVVNNTPIWASPPIAQYWKLCEEELGLTYNYLYVPSEITYNRTCLNKCTYEKEGKIDAEGNIKITNPSAADTACLQRITATEVCKKVNLLEICVSRNTDYYWKKYEECEKLTNYNDDFDDKGNHCYNRCQMIVDGDLDKDGKVNISSLVSELRPDNTNTGEQAVEKCKKIVTDENNCIRDLDTYYCISYILQHRSLKLLNIELECAKEHKTYPFYSVATLEKSRPCYDRCVMIKTGDLNEKDLIKSESFKKLDMNETQFAEAWNTCKKTVKETDVCTRDLYFYDCINYQHNFYPKMLKKFVECSLETKVPLVPYREPYHDDGCKTRCMMIKEKQLDSNGAIIRANFEKITINETIIDTFINECNQKIITKSCARDVVAYDCASFRINKFVDEMCKTNSTIAETTLIDTECYRLCVLIQTGDLTSEGEFNTNKFIKPNQNVTLVEEAVRACKAEVGDNDCLRILNYYNCAMMRVEMML